MDRDLGGVLGHAGVAGRLGDAGTLQPDPVDQPARALGQARHRPVEIEPGLGRRGGGRFREV